MRLIRTVAALTAFTLAGAGAAMAQATTARPPAARTPHPTAGKAECLSCHGPAANEHIHSVPAAHRYANAACVSCHRPAATMPPSSQHAMDAAHARCTVCHVASSPTNAKPAPASHAAYHASICQSCHEAAPRS
jgi:hypothetical protein